MTEAKKAREFWITEAQRKMYAFNDNESAEQCAKRSDAFYDSTGSHVIHAIEHSAYQTLIDENEMLSKDYKSLMKTWKQTAEENAKLVEKLKKCKEQRNKNMLDQCNIMFDCGGEPKDYVDRFYAPEADAELDAITAESIKKELDK